MLTALLAVRGTWVGILFVLAGIAVIWLVVRAVIDFANWFKEEIIDDYRQRKEKRKRSSDSDRAKRV